MLYTVFINLSIMPLVWLASKISPNIKNAYLSLQLLTYKSNSLITYGLSGAVDFRHSAHCFVEGIGCLNDPEWSNTVEENQTVHIFLTLPVYSTMLCSSVQIRSLSVLCTTPLLSPTPFFPIPYPLIIYRNLEFVVNQQHTYNCPVSAMVSDLNLELSSRSIILSEQYCASVDTGNLLIM